MGQVLAKAKMQLYDCKLVTGKLRAMLQTADEQVRSLKKQSTFLAQLAAKTIPNAIHCLSMRLTIDYYLLSPVKRKFPRTENLENPNLYHYALFSDNVLAASVVVNSAIMNAKVKQLSTLSCIRAPTSLCVSLMGFWTEPIEPKWKFWFDLVVFFCCWKVRFSVRPANGYFNFLEKNYNQTIPKTRTEKAKLTEFNQSLYEILAKFITQIKNFR